MSVPVARVVCKDSNGKKTGTGSGFLVTDRMMITNEHVIDDCAELEVVFDEDTTVGARALESDKKKDLALLELDEPARAPAVLFESDEVAAGTPIVAVGFPGINDFAAGQSLDKPSHISGVVENDTDEAKAGRRILLISAAISPGNSGGPVVDRCGRVVGVVTFFVTDTKSGARVRAAVHVLEVLAFAEANDVNVRRDPRPCEPEGSSNLVGAVAVSLGMAVTALVFALRKPVMRRVDERRERSTQQARGLHRAPPQQGSESRAFLVGLGGAYEGQSVPLDGGGLTVGRDPAVCGLVLAADTPGISRRHAQVRVGQSGRVEVRDCWSSKGTVVSGRKISAGHWVEVASGSVVEFGGPGARFRVESAATRLIPEQGRVER